MRHCQDVKVAAIRQRSDNVMTLPRRENNIACAVEDIVLRKLQYLFSLVYHNQASDNITNYR